MIYWRLVPLVGGLTCKMASTLDKEVGIGYTFLFNTYER